MFKTQTLILIDYHPADPFIVRSHQFLSRAAAFAEQAPENLAVEIWIPSPKLKTADLQRRIGLEVPDGLVKFGPPRTRKILNANLTLTFIFRRWVKKQLKRKSQSSQPIVYLRTLKLAAALIPLLQELQIPYIFETHEIFSKNSKSSSDLLHIEREVYAKAALVVPISKPLAEDLVSEFQLDCPVILPSGHNGSLSNITKYDPAAPIRFLYIGSLHRWKGIDDFLIATKDLNIPTDIVGDGGGIRRLETFVEERGLNHVVLHGHQDPDQLEKFYTKGSICILPLSEATIAQRYTSPLKLFEYTSAGRPVIIGAAPSITTIPGASSAVCLVENDWRSATKRLIDDPAERNRLAEEAPRFASQYTWSNISLTLLNTVHFRSLQQPD